MTNEPDIFKPDKDRDSFKAGLLYHAMGTQPEFIKDIIQRARVIGQHEVLLTINGVKLSAFAAIDWLEKGFDDCVNRRAEELVRERLGDRLEKVTDVINEFQQKLTDAINATDKTY